DRTGAGLRRLAVGEVLQVVDLVELAEGAADDERMPVAAGRRPRSTLDEGVLVDGIALGGMVALRVVKEGGRDARRRRRRHVDGYAVLLGKRAEVRMQVGVLRYVVHPRRAPRMDWQLRDVGVEDGVGGEGGTGGAGDGLSHDS